MSLSADIVPGGAAFGSLVTTSPMLDPSRGGPWPAGDDRAAASARGHPRVPGSVPAQRVTDGNWRGEARHDDIA